MKFLYSLTGANIPVIKEFTIDKTSNIKAGEIVKRNSDGIIDDSNIGDVIGVSAETHTGEKDILNERNDGDKLRIDITRGGVYEVDAFTATANSQSSENALVAKWGYLNSSLAGGRIVLVEKGDDSANTDQIGTVREIISDTISNSVCTFSVSEGGTICEGDVYAILPPYAFVGVIASDRVSFVPYASEGANVKTVRCNEKTCKVEVEIRNKLFD